jgi:hypothetical protein
MMIGESVAEGEISSEHQMLHILIACAPALASFDD